MKIVDLAAVLRQATIITKNKIKTLHQISEALKDSLQRFVTHYGNVRHSLQGLLSLTLE